MIAAVVFLVATPVHFSGSQTEVGNVAMIPGSRKEWCVVQQAHFTGHFDLKIDPRRHLTIPASLRRTMADDASTAFMAVPGENRRLWLYRDKLFPASTPEIDSSERIIAFHAGIALATRLELDKRGRVLLPEKLILHFGIRDDVTLVGVGDHLEVWNSVDWPDPLVLAEDNAPIGSQLP
jgi:MraZ protein